MNSFEPAKPIENIMDVPKACRTSLQPREGILSEQEESYKDRFKIEYHELKERYEKLKKFNTKIEASNRSYYVNHIPIPEHACPDDMLRDQQRVMGEYLHILEVRAVIEGIEI